jgi:hypothetical protein
VVLGRRSVTLGHRHSQGTPLRSASGESLRDGICSAEERLGRGEAVGEILAGLVDECGWEARGSE